MANFGIIRGQHVLGRLPLLLTLTKSTTRTIRFGFAFGSKSHQFTPMCTGLGTQAWGEKTQTNNSWHMHTALSVESRQGGIGALQQVRYASGKKVKIPPTKPLHFDYSGDLEKTLPEIDAKEPIPGYENLTELKEADETVQKLFSVEFGDGRIVLNKQITDLLQKVQEHPADIKSLETKIAILTVKIRNQMKHALEFRKDKVGKSHLVERIQARKKSLRILRFLDYEKFEWLLRELKIKYVPTNPYDRKESRKAARKRIAGEKAKAIRMEKIKAFRERLEEEQLKFIEHKDQEMRDIEQQLKQLGIEEMDSLKETLEALGMSHMYTTTPRYVNRRRFLLKKKFEIYGIQSKKKGKQATAAAIAAAAAKA